MFLIKKLVKRLTNFLKSYRPYPDILLSGELLDEDPVNFLGLLHLVGLAEDGGHLTVHLVFVITLHRLLQHLHIVHTLQIKTN